MTAALRWLTSRPAWLWSVLVAVVRYMIRAVYWRFAAEGDPRPLHTIAGRPAAPAPSQMRYRITSRKTGRVVFATNDIDEAKAHYHKAAVGVALWDGGQCRGRK